MQRSALCRSRRKLSNKYLLAKIGVDTAENEPLEVWGKFNSLFIRLLSEDAAEGAVDEGPIDMARRQLLADRRGLLQEGDGRVHVARSDLEGRDLEVEEEAHGGRQGIRPGGSVRGEHANLTGLFLSCIEAKFCK